MSEDESLERVLVLDDEPAIQSTLVRILRKPYREFTLASSAEEARHLLKVKTFDLILCDILLPGESGIDFARDILPQHPNMAFVMVSGVDEPRTVEQAIEMGVDGYIVKPFKVSEVMINVSTALRRKALEMERHLYLSQLEQLVEDRTKEIRKTLDGVIQVVAQIVETRDPYTAGHQQRVAKLACAVARKMGLPEDQIKGIRMASVIHDVGKISVPTEILSKPVPLRKSEFAMCMTHPETGYEILKGIDFPWPLAELVYQHHERMNGSGYPRNLPGAEILLGARIIAVADVVEAMASDRPYRPALGIKTALEEIEGKKGLLYDSDAVEACLWLFQEGGFHF